MMKTILISAFGTVILQRVNPAHCMILLLENNSERSDSQKRGWVLTLLYKTVLREILAIRFITNLEGPEELHKQTRHQCRRSNRNLIFSSFEVLECVYKIDNVVTSVVVVYRPPTYDEPGITFNTFIDDFSTFLEYI